MAGRPTNAHPDLRQRNQGWWRDRCPPVFRARRVGGARPYSTAESRGCGIVAETPEACGGDIAARARDLDRELRRLARGDSAARRVLGLLVSRFIAIRGFERFCFVRLDDYGPERLGWSGRQLQDMARVAAAMARLPAIEQAFRCAALDWSKARLLVAVASPDDEEKWLNVAATTDTRTLATLTANARAAAREERRPGGAAFAQAPPGEGVQPRGAAGALPEMSVEGDQSRDASGGGDAARSASMADADAADDDDERVLVRVPCTKRAIRLWSEARRLAPRLAGRALALWEVAQLIAAEASSAPGPYGDLWQQEPWRRFAADRDRGEARRPGRSADASDAAVQRPTPPSRPVEVEDAVSPLEMELERLDELDAFELDAAMRRVRGAMQRRQSELGSSLALFLDLRLHAELGYPSSADYVRERLGLPDRTARDLVHVAQGAKQKSSELAAAYARGELSWLRTLTLLRVVRTWNAAAWIQRAGEVTLRRLTDEVAWAAEQSVLDPRLAAAMPPPHGHDLGAGNSDRRMCARGGRADESGHGAAASENDERRMCARGGRADDTTHRSHDELFGVLGRFRVTFLAPLSVSRQFRTVMQGFAHPTEPRWLAFERMLEQVLAEWRRQPRHRDPVFERDGYRCTAPGCSSCSNLHDHHIVPRSRGGTNEMGNRTTLCAWHHLRAVHGGLATASGQAPDEIDWELGLAAGREPLIRTRGDRYRNTGHLPARGAAAE